MLTSILRNATYKDGGRGPLEWDCWGLSRHLRHHLYGRRLLSSWGEIRADSYRQMTGAYGEVLPALKECAPCPGALALAWRPFAGTMLLVHIGCVVEANNRLMVCDIKELFTHPRLITLADFERESHTVSYHDDH